MVSLNNYLNFKKTFESLNSISGIEMNVVVVDSSNNEEISNYVSSKEYSNLGIRYFWIEPKGVYQAMNFGLSLCEENSLVWFLNPGDVLVDFKALIKLLELLKINEKDWGFCQAIYDNSMESIFPLTADGINAFKILTGVIPVSHQAVLAKSSLLNNLGGFDLKYKIASDLDLLTRMAICTEPIFIDSVMVRIDTSGISHTKIARLFLETFSLARKYKFESIVQTCLRFLSLFFYKLQNSQKLWKNI